MGLSHDLISQFVKVTNDRQTEKKETIAYGTAVELDGKKYVRLDGSDMLTPVSSTADAEANERVTVLIKDHTATITGNASSPAARKQSVDDAIDQITEVEILVANKIDVESGRINTLVSENATIKERLTASEGNIEKLKTDKVSAEDLEAQKARIDSLEANTLTVGVADAKYAKIESLEATDGNFRNLESDYASFKNTTTDNLTAVNASISNLDANYANIDFANIGEAAVEKFYAVSGIIQNLTIETGVVVKELVGVLISGDLIKGNTIQADKLIVRGEDGLYYKLNVDALGETTASADPKYQNGLDGSVIIAKSVTAEKVSVEDLVAFGATIGGFHITNNSIYSGTKESAANTTLGLYLDNEGQIALGNEKNYLKFYKVDENNYAFEISLVKALQDDINSNAQDIQSLPKRDDLAGLQEQITGQGELIDGLRDTTNKLADDISANATAVEGLDERITSSDGAIQKLNASVNTLLGPAAYIREGTVKDADGSELPCLELGKEGSAFKVRITNKEIQFIDGQSIPAYISNQKLVIEKADVDNELRFGNFIWKKRSNGNMGLTWEGAND